MALGNTGSKSILKDTMEKIKDKIKDEKVTGLFIDTIADREITKRALALTTLWELILKQENEIKKIKPDVPRYGEDEKLIDESYSKTQMEKLKQARERLSKMIGGFQKGWNGDMSDVYNLNQQLGKDKGGSGKEDSAETT